MDCARLLAYVIRPVDRSSLEIARMRGSIRAATAQIASREKPRAENPMSNREVYHAGMRGPPIKPARSK